MLGAAVVEVEAPARWIAPGWVLLTAGVRLEGGSEGRPARTRRRLRAGAASPRSASASDRCSTTCPSRCSTRPPGATTPSSRSRARRPFRDVVSHVDAAIMGDEAPLFRRLGSLQRYVADGLREPEPERAVVERLARFMDASAAVLEPDGSRSVCFGKAPFAATCSARRARAGRAEADGWCAVAAPLAAREERRARLARSWPAAAARRPSPGARRRPRRRCWSRWTSSRRSRVRRSSPSARRCSRRRCAAATCAARAAVFGLDFNSPLACCSSATRTTLAGRPHLRLRRDRARPGRHRR